MKIKLMVFIGLIFSSLPLLSQIGVLKEPAPEVKAEVKAETPTDKLFKAIDDGNMRDFKKALEAGANVNAQAKNGYTPLVAAIRSNNKRMVEMLLEKGADVNAPAYFGMTALMEASGNRNKQVVKLLLDYHADPSMRNDEGLTALYFAEEAGECDKEGTIQLLKAAGSKK